MPGFLYQIEKREAEQQKKLRSGKTKPILKQAPTNALPFKTEGLSRLEIQRRLKTLSKEQREAYEQRVLAKKAEEEKERPKMKVLAISAPIEVHDRLEAMVKSNAAKSKKELALKCIELGLEALEKNKAPGEMKDTPPEVRSVQPAKVLGELIVMNTTKPASVTVTAPHHACIEFLDGTKFTVKDLGEYFTVEVPKDVLVGPGIIPEDCFGIPVRQEHGV